MRSPLLPLLALLASCLDEPSLGEGRAFLTVPADFSDHLVTQVGQPTGLVFMPDGRMLITTQSGRVRLFANGQQTTALDLSGRVCVNSERGLLGIALDPSFATNRHLYLYYTNNQFNNCVNNSTSSSPRNRVSRFTFDPATNSIPTSSERVLVDNILSLGGNHNGGDLHVAPDGFLYIAVGDSGCQIGGGNCGGSNQNAKFKSHLSGKILRVDRTTGAAPSDNPFFGAANARRCGQPGGSPRYVNDDATPCQEIWTYGLRNPFRFAWQPGTSTWFINDVGQNVWEEIDEGKRGANYGWNTREGFCANGQTCSPGTAPAGLTNPIYAYDRTDNCKSITGGAFVPTGGWSSSFDGDYLFGDYVCGKIFRLRRSSTGGVTVSEFGHSAGGSSIVAMRFGPGPGSRPSLYYTTYNNSGQIRRVDYNGAGGNRAPVAMLDAGPTSGAVPLTVSFDGSDSADPDAATGDRIVTYRWAFGTGATRDTTTPTTSFTYSSPGTFTATLRVIDSHGAISAPVSVTIRPGGNAPSVAITSPSATATLTVGEVVTLTATATDAEDGPLPASRLSWRVLKHHDDHTHPFFGPTTGNNLTITTDPPEDLLAATNSFLEVEVTATDSSGLSTTVSRNFMPRKINLTFATDPPGLRVVLDGTTPVTGPSTVVSWQAWGLRVRADDQVANGTSYVFQSWSDGGARDHTITTPAAAATYTAKFTAAARFAVKINFQPAASPVPPGFLVDSGAVFGARGNGFSYGWNAVTNETRDRNAANSPDQAFDTLNHMQKPSNPNAAWELAVPNGTYRVRLVAGDPNYIDSNFQIRAESTLIVSGVPTDTSRWLDRTATITVADGRLTLSNATGASNNKVCFIEVTKI